jgi:hypothetical protein
MEKYSNISEGGFTVMNQVRKVALPLLASLSILLTPAASFANGKSATTETAGVNVASNHLSPADDELEMGTGAAKDDDSTPEERERYRQEDLQKFAELKARQEARNQPSQWGATVDHKIDLFKQTTPYYCGPASARMSLSFHKYKHPNAAALPSQDTLAKLIGTTKAGSTTVGIATALNRYASTWGGFRYITFEYKTNQPYADFTQRVMRVLTEVKTPTAPVVLLQTKFLERYKGKSIRHYNTLSGWMKGSYVKANDPHFKNEYFGSFWDPIGSGKLKGIFKANWESSKEGTNLPMAY